jgi:putative copper export protein
MAIQAGVISAAQVQTPSATLSTNASGKALGNNASGWAWFWFAISLLFLVFSHLSARRRG